MNRLNAKSLFESNVANSTERESAKIWINLGIMIDGNYITLPLGLPLDTMRENKISNNDSDFNKRMALGNTLRAKLLEKAESIKPGETVELEGFTIQLRKVNESSSVEVDSEAEKQMDEILGLA